MKRFYLKIIFIPLILALVSPAWHPGEARAADKEKGKGKSKSAAAPKGSEAKTKPKTGEEKEPVSKLIETPEKPLSGEEAIDDSLSTPGFKYDVYACVKGREHPAAIWIRVSASSGGSAQLISIKPLPLTEVYQCIASAVSKLKVEIAGGGAGETSYPVLLPYPYQPAHEGWGYVLAEMTQAYTPYTGMQTPPPTAVYPEPPPPYYPPPPPPPPPPPSHHHKYPRKKDGGFGLYSSLVVLDRGLNGLKFDDDPDMDFTWYGRITGGFGLFVEALVTFKPPIAVGLELNFSFPKVKERALESQDKESCDFCEQDFLVRLLIRLKTPIMISSKGSIYPLVVFGYSDYLSRASSRSVINFHGITAGAGLGLEGYTRILTPFLEIRYMFHAGWSKDGDSLISLSQAKETLFNHNLTINFGIRLP